MDPRPHPIIMSLWSQPYDWEGMRGRTTQREIKRGKNDWKNTFISVLYLLFCTASLCTITHASHISPHHLFSSSPFYPFLWFVPYLALSFWDLLSLSASQRFLHLPPSFPCSFPRSLALPWWYLIAVKQEAGEQTAGEPTLILNCAICCSHMTELQNLSNAMMPHHIWHIDQSRPKSQRDRGREDQSEWKDIQATLNIICPMNKAQLWLGPVINISPLGFVYTIKTHQSAALHAKIVLI